MILATEADRPAIEAFLQQHIATSMFPLSNLRRYGMAGGHPRAVRFWCRWREGALTDVLTVSEEGMVFPQCPTGPWGAARVVLAGVGVRGILGDGAQVAALHAALGLPTDPPMNEEEPHYELQLNDLCMPDVAGFSLVPLAEAPRDLVVNWRAAFREEVLTMRSEDYLASARRDIDGYLEADTHRVLYQAGQPVAMTGFNATLSDTVQIGGVYTPPDLRSRGLARRAVAMHLSEARERGVNRAVLSAASPQASRAYEAIGFRPIGTFTILVYDEPRVVHV
ncbi:MAG: GNAT family N-acetyltransferase [Pseudomonadota bacterium]